MIIDAIYISIWDGDEIRTPAKVDLLTGKIFDIGQTEISCRYNTCESEYIEFADGSRYEVSQKDDGYFIDRGY